MPRTIRPNDLRLGNIVRVKSTGDIVAVVQITRSKVGYHKNNDNTRNLSYARYDDVEGVPFIDLFSVSPEIDGIEVMVRSGQNKRLYTHTFMRSEKPDHFIVELDNLTERKYTHDIQNFFFINDEDHDEILLDEVIRQKQMRDNGTIQNQA